MNVGSRATTFASDVRYKPHPLPVFYLNTDTETDSFVC